jgi:hypothetical protein
MTETLEQKVEMFVVASKIKAFIADADMRCAATLPEDLSAKVVEMLKAAIVRAKVNERSTVRGVDL